jgi:hypothetical protein
MVHNPYALRTVFGYHPQVNKNRSRFYRRLTDGQYKLMVILLDPWSKLFDPGCTEANAKQFAVVYKELAPTANEHRLRQAFDVGVVNAPFTNEDYNVVRDSIRILSNLNEAGYFNPGTSFKIPPHLLKD